MNTINEEEFDYQNFMKEGSIDHSKINTGPMAHQNRRKSAKNKITIRIDEEIIEQFKKIASEERGYQSLINLALREWLTAQSVKELLREELPEMLNKAVSTIQSTALPSEGLER